MSRRLLSVVPTLLGVIVAAFLLTRLLPGDPAAAFANSPASDTATVAAIRARLGLDLPVWRQFLAYAGGLLYGDLGTSITTGQPVSADLLRRLPASAELTLCAFLLAAGAGLPLGSLAALRPGSAVDHACRVISALGVAMPTFVTGLLLIYWLHGFAAIAPEPIGRLPPFVAAPPVVTGFLLADALLAGDGGTFAAAARQLMLPVITMALFALAPLARMTRAAMHDALGADFVRTARAAGLRPRQVVLAYALPNALPPILTTLGLVFSYMLGANVLVERVFAWPGIGSYALDALTALDYAPVQGFMLVMAGVSVTVNLLVDLACCAIDPRAGLTPR